LLAASINPRFGRLEHRRSDGILEGHAYSAAWISAYLFGELGSRKWEIYGIFVGLEMMIWG
jgi:hypothetical protein